MADDITDVYIATEAGDAGWQSLTALTAAQVDAKLPIESDDGTVKLDSPSAKTFTVSTGGQERVKVEDAAATFNVQVKTSSVSGLADNDASIAFGAAVTMNASNQEFLFGGYDADYTGGTLCGLGASSNYIWSKAASGFAIASDRIAFNSNVSAGATACNWSMETDGTFVGAAGSSIETSKIGASRHNIGDASIAFGAQLLTNNHTPTQPNSIATKQTVDDKIWVGTTTQYNAISTKNPTTLYCLTD